MENFEHSGRITINKKKRNLEGEGFLSETCLNVSGVGVKLMLYNNPATKKTVKFSNSLYEKVLKRYNLERAIFLASLYEYFREFLQSITFFKVISSYILVPEDRSKTLIKTKNLHVKTKQNEKTFSVEIIYGLNRNKNGQLEVTREFTKFLKSTGEKGKCHAKQLMNLSIEDEKELWEPYSKKNKEPLWFWLFLDSVAKDLCLNKKQIKNRYPAITKGDFDKGLKGLLQTSKPIIIIKDRKIDYFTEEAQKHLGFVPTDISEFPNAHPSRLPIIKAGGEAFTSFMSHKLLHYENKIFYKRWKDTKIKIKENFAKLQIKGGYKELIQRLGESPTGKNIDKLRKLLYFQAHFVFTIPEDDGGCRIGNLIALEERKNKFGQVGEIWVTAGSMLTPEAVFSVSSKDSGRLLIPFIDLPEKMIGYPASWGSQALLHMLILEYLTEQSREFAKNGSVIISPEKLGALATEARIPSGFIHRLDEVIELFCCPEQGFLDKQGNQYSINKKNERAKTHLIEQGKMREKRSQQSKQSKLKRKRLK